MKRRVYNVAQVAQHSQLILDLEWSNAIASHLMLRLGRMRLQDHVLWEELASVVRSMSLQLFLCEQIAFSGVHKHWDVINLILGTTCDYCLESGETRKLQNNQPDAQVLKPSEAWAIQVVQLSGLIISVAHKVSQNSLLSRGAVERSLCSLAGFSKVLSRQRRHLDQISFRHPTKINVIDDRSAVCPDCGHPYADTGAEG